MDHFPSRWRQHILALCIENRPLHKRNTTMAKTKEIISEIQTKGFFFWGSWYRHGGPEQRVFNRYSSKCLCISDWFIVITVLHYLISLLLSSITLSFLFLMKLRNDYWNRKKTVLEQPWQQGQHSSLLSEQLGSQLLQVFNLLQARLLQFIGRYFK